MTTTIETTDAPVIASIDDIDKQFAARAFHGTSFDPEKRGEARREGYAEHVNGLYAEFWTIAKTDEQRAILADEMERYRQGYIGRLNAYLASHSRVYSSMIAGPANFPVRQMEKRNRSVDNKVSEWIEWVNRARTAIRAKILDARTDEAKASAEWDLLKADLLYRLEGSRSMVNMTGKIERLAQNGEVELVEKALDLVKTYNETHAKPAITARHKFWTFADVARAVAVKQEAASNQESEVIATADGIEIIANPEANRVQIVFDAKPDATMIGKLKAQGWRWAPSEGAWQRQLTNAARYSAVGITGATQAATVPEQLSCISS